MSRAALGEARLTTNLLTRSQGIAYLTDQVHVPLGLVERKRQSKRQGDISPDKGSSLYQETEITQMLEQEQFLEQVLKYGQSPQSQGKRIAIIGEPGAGKTTLLQQIAQWALNEVEKVAVIWISLSSLEGKTIEEYLLKRWLKDGLQISTVTQEQEDSFVDWFTKSQVLLLLDGVDEMPISIGSSPLLSIANQTTGWISRARIFMTCRLNLWDSRINPLDMFDTYRMLDLSYPKQVEQFIKRWFLPQGEAGIGQGERLCNALKEPGIERIRDLIKNPLRLTLLCFNWYLSDGQLPGTKAELYQQFVEDFYELKQTQFPTVVEQRKCLNLTLSQLAREAIDKELSRFCLSQDFIVQFMGELEDENSLFYLALKLGLINKVGIDATNPRKAVYAFLHTTFQEYFAALAIDNWYFFLNHNNENPNPILDYDSSLLCNNGVPSYRIFNPEWRGTIILWIGLPSEQVSKSIKEDFIASLIGFEDGIDCLSYFEAQAYLLAAQLVSEIRNYHDEEIVFKTVLAWSFGHFDEEQDFWSTYFDSCSKEYRENLFQLDHLKLLKYIDRSIDKCKSSKIIIKVSRLLGQIGEGKIEASYSLLNLTLQSKETSVVCEILKNLEKIGIYDLENIEVLSNLFCETKSSLVKRKIVSFLSKCTEKKHLHNFHSFIKEDYIEKPMFWRFLQEDSSTDKSIPYSLKIYEIFSELSGNIPVLNDESNYSFEDIIKSLCETEDLSRLQKCAWKLRGMGIKSTIVHNALTNALLRTKDKDTLWYITDCIKSTTSTNESAKVVIVNIKNQFTQELRTENENLFQDIHKVIWHCCKFLSYEELHYLLKENS